MPEKGKTAIICAGGGMRSAHSAGFLYAMATSLGITSPDIIVGSSGAAGNVLYYTAKQYDSLKYVWEELLSTRKFISFARFWRIMNVDYLVDHIFRERTPLDTHELFASPIKWLIPATDSSSGIPHYFDADSGTDPYELLRATKAIPLLYRRRIRIGSHTYFDGEMGPTIDDEVGVVAKLGATKVLVLTSEHAFLAYHPIIRELYLRSLPREARTNVRRDFTTRSIDPRRTGVEVVVVAPERLPASVATRDAWKLRATFERGVADALSMEEKLRTLFA